MCIRDRAYTDYRKVIERKDIDGIVCATVDHWHKRICIDAMESGKDMYVEKPMTRYLGEAFELYDAVKRTKRKVQVGSQITSCGNFAKAAELIAQGKMGPLVLAQGSYMRNNPKGEWNYRLQPWATKGDIQWTTKGGKIGWMREDMKQIPFNADHYFRWRKYLPYCAGLLGDLIETDHEVDPDLDKLNVNGGAIALGHPFGMTGARIMTTLLNGLEDADKEFGVESMCVGGGQGMAMVVQRLS